MTLKRKKLPDIPELKKPTKKKKKSAYVKGTPYEVGNKKPPKEYQIKKGQVLNPTGISISPERRALKQLTEQALIDCIQKVFTGTEDEAVEMIKDPQTTLGHKVILRAAIDAAHNGNYSKFNEILERVIGRVPTKIDMTTKGQSLNLNPEDKDKVKDIVGQLESEY